MAWEISITAEGWHEIREKLDDWDRASLIAAITDDTFERVEQKADQHHAKRAADSERKRIKDLPHDVLADRAYELSGQAKKAAKPVAKPKPTNQFAEIIDSLACLGMSASSQQVEAAVAECFPNGIQNLDSGEVVRAVFLCLKRKESR